MPLNRSFIGRQHRSPEAYEVSREKIREFAVATGNTHPVHLDPAAAVAAGHPDVIAPPTFLSVVEMRASMRGPAADPAMNLDHRRVVHGGQRIVAHRPVVAGDVLTVTTVIDEIRDHGKHEVLVLRHEVSDDAGEPVATIMSTLVSRGTAAQPAGVGA